MKIFTPLHMFQKLNIQSIKCKCKSCSELNFLQKSPLTHMPLSPRGVELEGSKDFHF